MFLDYELVGRSQWRKRLQLFSFLASQGFAAASGSSPGGFGKPPYRVAEGTASACLSGFLSGICVYPCLTLRLVNDMKFFLMLILLLGSLASLQAEDAIHQPQENALAFEQGNALAASWFTPDRGGEGPRSVYWRPMLSFLLPGFDQYLAGHDATGLAYSTVWLGAGLWSIDRSNRLQKAEAEMQWQNWSEEQRTDYRTHEELPRQAALASQYGTAVGFMSAWHSFRTSVETQRAEGRYAFLKHEETPIDLLKAPFQFSFLQRQTTWIPLVIAAGLGALGSQYFPDRYERDPFSRSDAAYAQVFSYNAGVSEEAAFRGYLQPVLYESWNSPFWSNLTQATVFSLAHLGTNDRPFPQLGMGYYFGWLQQKRDWTLSEGIFIHAWWDVIVISTNYLVRLKAKDRAPAPILWLPTLTLTL